MDKRLSIETKMEKEDYKKFLYTTTLFRNGKSIPMLILIALGCAVLLNFDSKGFNFIKMLGYFVVFLIIAIGSVVFKIERLNKARLKSDESGIFNTESIIDFCEDYMFIKVESFESESKIPYTNIFKVIETKDFYLTYLNDNQASVIRKKDITKEQEVILREIYNEKLKDKFKSKVK